MLKEKARPNSSRETKVHYKLYKAKKKWVVAGMAVTTLGLASMFTTIGSGTVNAATEGDAAVSTTQTKQSTNTVADQATAEEAKTSSSASETNDVTSEETDAANQAANNTTVSETAEKAESVEAASTETKQAQPAARSAAVSATTNTSEDTAKADPAPKTDGYNDAKQAVSDSSVKNAANQASGVGVNVSKGTTQTVTAASGTKEDVDAAKKQIQQDYDTQTKQLADTKAKQDTYNAQYTSAKAVYDKAQSDYQAAMAKYNSDLSKYNSDESAYQNALQQKAQADANYQSAMAQYQSDLSAYNSALSQQGAANQSNASSQAQYDAELAQYNKDYAQYQKDLAAYNGTDTTPHISGNNSEWSDSQIMNFLGSGAGNVVLVSGQPGSSQSIVSGTQIKVGSAEYTKAENLPTSDGTGNPLKGHVGFVFKLGSGVAVKYANVLTDSNGNKLDVVLKVTSASGDGYIDILRTKIATQVFSDGPTTVNYSLTFYKAGTSTAVSIPNLVGFGDIDAGQSLAINQSNMLVGKNLSKTSSGHITSQGSDQANPSDTSNQAWFKTTGSSLSWTWYGNYTSNKGSNVNEMDVGGINFAIDVNHLPKKPIEPTKPTPPSTTTVNVPNQPTQPTPPTVIVPSQPTPPTKPTAPTIPLPTKTVLDATYHLDVLLVKPTTPAKTADNEGKTLIAGDTSTQHITQDTGVNADISDWYVGDAIIKTDDGRMPVSYNLSDFTITDAEGNDVTSQGKFSELDQTVGGKDAHVIKWTPNSTGSLTSASYTLNTKFTTVADHIADSEVDAGISPFGTTPLHDYNEYTPDTDKHWTEGSQTVDNKVAIDGDQIHAAITMTLPDPTTLSTPLRTLNVVDDFTSFQDKVDFVSAQVLENGANVTDQYTITAKDGKVIATRKDAASAPSGKVELDTTFALHKDVATNTQLINNGSGTLNADTKPTPPVTLITHHPDPDKHWVEGSQTVDGKTYINDDQITADMNMTLPDPATLVAPLTKVQLDDDYTKYQGNVDFVSAHVFENGTDVTDQYTITTDAGHVIATRKAAASAPAGKVTLKSVFKIHDDVKSGTTFLNGGSGTLNTDTVPVPDVPIVTYTPKTDKHWVEGTQNVDGLIYVNGSTITGQVSMTLPEPDSLATKLTNVVVDDDFTNYQDKADFVSAQVLENGTDVTRDYNITSDNGHVTATRKDASSTPAGNVVLKASFKIHDDVKSGTTFTNGGSGTINSDKVPTPNQPLITYTPEPDKHWTLGAKDVDGKTFINGDTATAQVSMELPEADKLAVKLNKVALDDDFTNYQDKVTFVSATVTEAGADVTDQYNIIVKDGHVTATRKDAASAPSGKAVLTSVFQINHDVKSGTIFINSGSGTVNTETVPTPDQPIITYTPDTDKHWTEGDQVVDGKIVINDSVVTGQVSMTLPEPGDLAAPLTKVQVDDDYTNYQDKVAFVSAHVLENGTDVTGLYSVTVKDGHVTAIRKDAASTPAGNVMLKANFMVNHDVKSGTIFINSGSGTINLDTVPTPKQPIITYTPKTDKHWVEGDQTVDGKTYINDDKITGEVSMTLPEPDKLGNKLSKVEVVDNYTNYQDKVAFVSAQVLENDTDVTDQYTIVNRSGQIVATRKDAGSTPAGNVVLKATFQINHDVKSGTTFLNSGSGTINSNRVPTPEQPIITYTPDTDKHWVEGEQAVDGKTYINDDKITGEVSMTLPDPDKLATKLTKVQVDDDYTDYADKVNFVSAQVLENGTDVTNQYTIESKDGHVTATRKDAGSTPAGNVVLKATFQIDHDVKSGTTFTNGGSGTINSDKVPTPDRPIITYTPETDKHWVEGSQTVDGKTYIDGDTVNAQVTMTLPEPEDLATKLTNVQVADDYSNYADKVDLKNVTISENGKDVTSQYTIDASKDGLVLATRKDAGTTPAGKVVMNVTFQIRQDVESGSTLLNGGFGTINSDKVPTPNQPILTFKTHAEKHWTEGSQTVDGKVYVNGDMVHGQVSMTFPDPDKLATKLSKIQIIDNYSKFADLVDYKSAHVYENGTDVTDQYTIETKDGQVIATRKDASSTPAGKAVLQADFQIHQGVKSGTELPNSGSGTINTSVVPTPDTPIVTYTPSPEKHWTLNNSITDNQIYINGADATAEITTNLPDSTQLATKLSKIEINDDYSKFADKVDVKSVVIEENGTNVTSLYAVKVSDGHIIATRKDASTTPSGTVKMISTFTIHSDVADKTTLTNSGSMTVNTDTEPVPDTPIVTWQPKPEKDVEIGYVTGDTNNSDDGKLVAKGQVLTYPLSDNPVPANRAEDIKEMKVVDTIPDGTTYKGFKAWVPDANGKLTDVTSHIKATVDGQTVTFTEDATLLARYNSDKTKEVAMPIIDLQVTTSKDGAKLSNSYQRFINGHGFNSNTVTNYTPNPDPDKTEFNNLGVKIDGKTVLPGSVNNYQLRWDLSQYKDVVATDDQIAKGFGFVEDIPDGAVSANMKDFTYTDSTGAPVKGITATAYNSIDEAPSNVIEMLGKAGVKPNGAFIFFSVNDPKNFYTNYVQKGLDIAMNLPMTVTQKLEGDFENAAYEIDFGNAYATEIVKNHVPNITPTKDVVIGVGDSKSLNGSEIKMGTYFDYKLGGGVVPKGTADPITEYGYLDDYDQAHDKYSGQYKVLLSKDLTLADGTVITAGTDVTQYTTQTVDEANGVVHIEFNANFLAKIDPTSTAFGADAYLQMQRIAAGDVYNAYENTINGVEYTSNRVHTHTNEPEKPVTPTTPSAPVTPVTPTTPTKKTPKVTAKTLVQKASVLPQLGGGDNSLLSYIGLAAMAISSIFAGAYYKVFRADRAGNKNDQTK